MNEIATLIDAGLPKSIATWITGLATHAPQHAVVKRAARFVQFANKSFENAETVRRSWASIESVAKLEGNGLVTLFLVMPDRPEYQPFSAIYGNRRIPPDAEQERYNEQLQCVRKLLELLNPHRNHYLDLVRDSTATPEASAEYQQFSTIERECVAGLLSLERLLTVVDPKAKIPTKHWVTESEAAKKNYVLLLAGLNRYLVKPKHTALATLANINCVEPNVTVHPDQLRQAWSRGADKRI